MPIEPIRCTGKTTRIANNAVDRLLSEGEVFVYDHAFIEYHNIGKGAAHAINGHLLHLIKSNVTLSQHISRFKLEMHVDEISIKKIVFLHIELKPRPILKSI